MNDSSAGKGREKYTMSIEHFIVSESKERIQKQMEHVKRTRSQLEEA